MRIGSIRQLEDLKSVLKNPGVSGPDPAYWVFYELAGDEKWANLTVITPGSYGGEFPKTYGHYHAVDTPPEIYHLVEGEGVLLMQEKKMDGENWVEDEVEKVYLIKAKPGDEVVITPEWGHSWSNTGIYPLLSFDNWRSGHTPADYEVIERLQGMAYYLISENGEVKAVPNPSYKNLPEPEWVTADGFRERIS